MVKHIAGELDLLEVNNSIDTIKYRLNGCETVCTMTLKSGMVITETSGCHDMRKYSARRGMQAAYDKAYKKLIDMFIFTLTQNNPDFRKQAVLSEDESLLGTWHKVWAIFYTGKNWTMPYYDAVGDIVKNIPLENGIEELKYLCESITTIKFPADTNSSDMLTYFTRIINYLENPKN